MYEDEIEWRRTERNGSVLLRGSGPARTVVPWMMIPTNLHIMIFSENLIIQPYMRIRSSRKIDKQRNTFRIDIVMVGPSLLFRSETGSKLAMPSCHIPGEQVKVLSKYN